MRQRPVSDAIEAAENTFHVIGGNAHTIILHAEDDTFFIGCSEPHAYVDLLAGIFYGVIQNIEHRGPQIFTASHHASSRAIRRVLITQSFRRQMVTGARCVHTFLH